MAVAKSTGYIDTDIEMPKLQGDTSGVYDPTLLHPNDAGNLVEQGAIMGGLSYICN